MVGGMERLCKKADILEPNRTEATFLLGREYKSAPLTPAEAEEQLRALAEMGPRRIVLTGVGFSEQDYGAACFDAQSGQVDFVLSERIPGVYHGTGDIFASVLLAGLLRERTLQEAARIAVDFTCGAIRRTAEAGTDPRFGVHFEAGLVKFAAEFA
jgi:pyridoxine kinase